MGMVIKDNRAFYCQCHFRKLKEMFFGKEFVDKTLENYIPKNNLQLKAKEQLTKEPLKSYFIFGEVGTGKTHLIAGLYDKYWDLSTWHETSVWKELDLIRDLRLFELGKIQINIFQEIRLGNIKRFFLDDIAKTKMTEFQLQELFGIFDDLYRFQCQIVITSNHNLEYLTNILGGAIVRRIDDMCEVVELK